MSDILPADNGSGTGRGGAGRIFAPLRRLIPRRFRRSEPVVPVVRLQGVIGVSSPLRPGLTLSSSAKMLDKAFAVPRAAAVAIVIKPPGGPPGESQLLFQRPP